MSRQQRRVSVQILECSSAQDAELCRPAGTQTAPRQRILESDIRKSLSVLRLTGRFVNFLSQLQSNIAAAERIHERQQTGRKRCVGEL